MSVYDKFQILPINNSLSFTYNDLQEVELFNISSNSNIFLNNIRAPNYEFPNENGIFFNSNNNFITFKSAGNVFLNDIHIQGRLNASLFPSNILMLNEFNKIESSYLPLLDNSIVYNSNVLGIGTSSPLAHLHIQDGDAFIQNGRIGIGTLPSYYFHLNKNDSMINIPAFVISTCNKHLVDIYPEKGICIINDEINEYPNSTDFFNSNLKLKILGLTKTTDLHVSSNTHLHNLYVNHIHSSNPNIIIPSNDILLSNVSLSSIISNVQTINQTLIIDSSNHEILFTSNIAFGVNGSQNTRIIVDERKIITSNLITSNHTSSNIITSNLTLLNYDSLTSNPFIESVLDIKGKIRLFNDVENNICQISANDDNLYLITSNHKLYSYNISSKSTNYISPIIYSSSLIFKAKFGNYGYYMNNDLYLNSIKILSNISIIDFGICPSSSQIFYINSQGHIVHLNTSTTIQIINSTISNIIRIETYIDNTYVVLTQSNEIFYFNGTTYQSITFTSSIQPLIIYDFSSGDNHTIVLTNQGVWSFGSNVNNLTYKKGYPTSLEAGNLTIALKINLLSNSNTFKIIKVKAYKNSSIVLDDKGFIYIFGNINKLYNTHQIYKINDIYNLIDFCCNNTEVFLLTYFNDIFTLIQNNEPIILQLSNDFYGTSIKSRGSILIGSSRFYKPTIKNSLFVDNFIGIGSNIIYDNKYPL